MVIKSKKHEGIVNLDRQRKKISNKKSDLNHRKTNATKMNYQKSKKKNIILRKSAHLTRMLEKNLTSCTTNTCSYTLGLYDGFWGSQRDYYELEDSEYTDPFLPNLNWNEDDEFEDYYWDDNYDPFDPFGHRLDSLVMDSHMENSMARFDNMY